MGVRSTSVVWFRVRGHRVYLESKGDHHEWAPKCRILAVSEYSQMILGIPGAVTATRREDREERSAGGGTAPRESLV